MIHVKNPYDYEPVYEEITEPSQTQPDQTLTLREILYNVSVGNSTGLDDFTGPGMYDEEDDFDFDDPTLDPDFNEMDAINVSSSLKEEIAVKQAAQKAQQQSQASAPSPEAKTTPPVDK